MILGREGNFNNAWEIEERNLCGRKVYRQGNDPDLCIALCEQDATHINELIYST